jgi:hypothetical protein
MRRLCPAPLSFAGLVVGSLTPDVGYYFGLFEVASAAHTPAGLFLICLPVGLLMLLVLQLLQIPFAQLLPQPHRGALLALPRLRVLSTLSAFGAAVASLLVGAMSHVAWDAFTHSTGYFVQLLPRLQAPVIHVSGHEIRFFNLLQHVSTLVGVVCILVAYAFFWALKATAPRQWVVGQKKPRTVKVGSFQARAAKSSLLLTLVLMRILSAVSGTTLELRLLWRARKLANRRVCNPLKRLPGRCLAVG